MNELILDIVVTANHCTLLQLPFVIIWAQRLTLYSLSNHHSPEGGARIGYSDYLDTGCSINFDQLFPIIIKNNVGNIKIDKVYKIS